MTSRLSLAVAAALAAGTVSFAFAQNPKDLEQAPQVAAEEQQGAAQAGEEAAGNIESTPPGSVNYANPPKSNRIPSDLARLHFAQEPIASPVKTGGPDDALVSGIVNALNNDGSLQGSKVSVSADDGVVTVTGATMTPDQKAKIGEIAVAQAGEGKVINTVLDSVT